MPGVLLHGILATGALDGLRRLNAFDDLNIRGGGTVNRECPFLKCSVRLGFLGGAEGLTIEGASPLFSLEGLEGTTTSLGVYLRPGVVIRGVTWRGDGGAIWLGSTSASRSRCCCS